MALRNLDRNIVCKKSLLEPLLHYNLLVLMILKFFDGELINAVHNLTACFRLLTLAVNQILGRAGRVEVRLRISGRGLLNYGVAP